MDRESWLRFTAERTMRVLALLGFIAFASAGMAQSAFDGTWRPDPQVFPPTRKPDVAELIGGVYRCQTCVPPYQIKADGSDQPVSGNPQYDTVSVKVIDDRTILKIGKRGGRIAFESKSVVSPDGKSKTDDQTIYGVAARPIEVTVHLTRVSAGPEGSHLVSGGWRATDLDLTNHAEDTIFKVVGDTLSMSDRMGRSFSAKLDGTEAPYRGSDEFTSVSLKLIDAHTLEESDKKDGRVVKISRWSIDPDGRTMHARFDDTHGHVQQQTGHKVEGSEAATP